MKKRTKILLGIVAIVVASSSLILPKKSKATESNIPMHDNQLVKQQRYRYIYYQQCYSYQNSVFCRLIPRLAPYDVYEIPNFDQRPMSYLYIQPKSEQVDTEPNYYLQPKLYRGIHSESY